MKFKSSYIFPTALALITLWGFLLRAAGIMENLALHPDEILIKKFIVNMYMNHKMDAGYAGGFFVIVASVMKCLNFLFTDWFYLTNITNVYGATSVFDPVVVGRWVNVFLGALTIPLIGVTARRITGSRLAGIVAGIILAAAPFSVEHAHYLESDIALLFAVCFAIWALARFIENPTFPRLILTALAAGFSAGVKFNSLFLLPLVLFALPWRKPKRALGMLGATLAVFALGLWLASPDIIDFRHYVPRLIRNGHRTFGETAGLLGPLHGQPFAREQMNFINFTHNFALSMGVLFWILGIAGAVLTFANKQTRKYWTITFFAPLFYFYYLIFRAPWVRSQETLPLIALMAISAAIPLVMLAHLKLKKSAAKPITTLAAAILLAPIIVGGGETASIFAHEDVRRLASIDLAHSFPREMTYRGQSYSSPAEQFIIDRIVPVPQKEKDKITDDFLMVVPNMPGRGNFDWKARTYTAKHQAFLDDLKNNGIKVAEWAPLDGFAPLPTFRSQPIELWRTPASNTNGATFRAFAQSRSTIVFDPHNARDGKHSNFAHMTFFRGEENFGARKAVCVTHHKRRISIGGPGDPADIRLICMTRERAAKVKIKALGHSRRLSLGAYDVDVWKVPPRTLLAPRLSRFEHVTFAAKKLHRKIDRIPCYLFVAFSDEETAAILLDLGYEREALPFLEAAEKVRGKAELCDPSFNVINGTAFGEINTFEILPAAGMTAPEGVRLYHHPEFEYTWDAAERAEFREKQIEKLRELPRETSAAFTFGNRLALTSAEKVDGSLEVKFAPLAENLPQLAVALYAKKHGRMKRAFVAPLAADFSASLPLPERGGGGYIAIESAVEFFPGALRINGGEQTMIPLETLEKSAAKTK